MADNLLTRIGKAFTPDAPEAIEKVSPTQTLGTTMTTASEIIGVTTTTDDRALNLHGQQRYIRFQEMVRDVAIVAASVRLFLNLMANAVWTVNPPDGLNANEEPVAQGYADQMYDWLFGMTSSWSSVVRKTAAFRLHGFAILEWTAKRDPDGSIGLLDIEHRPQQTIARWLRDQGGTIEGVVQQVSGRQPVTLPRSKIVYAVDDVLTDHPEGVGLFRHLYFTSERLRQFLELEEIGFTTDLRGIPIARAPLGEEEAKVVAAGPEGSEARGKASAILSSKLKGLRDFVNKHIRNKMMGLLLPSDTYVGKTVDGGTTPVSVPKWALELLNGDSSSFEAMDKAVTRMNQELARILGTEHLLLGADGSGSLALAQSKVGTFYLTVTSTLQDLVEVFDRDVITPVADLNGWPDELRPQMGVNEISGRSIAEVTAALKDLALAGATMLPSDPAVGEIYDLLGLARPPEDGSALDSSLNPRRGDPAKSDPATTDLNANPEDGGVAKRRMIRSRPRRRRAAGR